MESTTLLTSDSTPIPAASSASVRLPESGSARAWLNAIPNPPSLVDLFSINEDNFAIKCIRLMLENRPIEVELHANHPETTLFNHFFFESANREKVFGSDNFGIGYPLILTQENGQVVQAPLFFWRLRINPSPNHADVWHISSDKHQPILPNYALLSWIDANHGTELVERAEKLIANDAIHPNSLKDLCDGISLLLHLREGSYALGINRLPDAEDILDAQKKGTLQWSAVVGFLPELPRQVATTPPVLVTNIPSEMEWEHNIACLPLDSSQREALTKVQSNAITLIEGASGTGKTYTAANILLNALSNGYKCMVVSQSLNTLRDYQRYLNKLNLGDFSFLIRDIRTDKSMLLDMLRAGAEKKVPSGFDNETYQAILSKTLREQNILDKSWHNLHRPFFGNWDFTTASGHFLRANRACGKELLASQLNVADFEFTTTEFEQIKADIKASEPVFKQFPNLSHPLSKLQNTAFASGDRAAVKSQVSDMLGSAQVKISALQHQFIETENEYEEMLTNYFEQYFQTLQPLCKSILNRIEDGITQHGSDFDHSNWAIDGLKGVFSEKQKIIHEERDYIFKLFEELRKEYSAKKLFDFDFPAENESKTIKKVGAVCRDFQERLHNWWARHPQIVREELQRLNAKNANYIVDFKSQATDLEQAFNSGLNDLNTSGIFSTPFSADLLTITQKQHFIETVLAEIENTKFYLRDFDDYYQWRSHWTALSPASQKVVAALGKLNPKNWAAAFESWYLHSLLQRAYSADLAPEKESINLYIKGLDKMRDLIPDKIRHSWLNRRRNALKELRDIHPGTYNLWFGKKNQSLAQSVPIETLFEEQIHALTETLPVMLVTPKVANDLMRLSNLLFDVVIIDEAHNIPKQEAYSLFDQAKSMVVCGDEKQDMTPFAQDDLFEFCKKTSGIPIVTLEYQHQTVAEEWVLFNQTAFDTPFKRIPSESAAHDVTQIANVGGRYEEDSETNEAEARQLIGWLNDIEPGANKKYPAVAIACATIGQRDYIASQLLKIIQRKSPGYEKLLHLRHNGMGVYQFAELQGLHVDVLMVSLTHGAIDSRGTLTGHLDFWNKRLGFNQLHVLLTRSSSRIFITHSIPEFQLQRLCQDFSAPGVCLLAHLAVFGERVELGDPKSATATLEAMRKNLGRRKIFFDSNVFMEEVEIALQPYFEPEQIIRDATIAGVAVPMLIRTTDADGRLFDHVLLFDGILGNPLYPSYGWEEKLRLYLDRNNISVIPTLSVRWWKSPRQEARNLAGQILTKTKL